MFVKVTQALSKGNTQKVPVNPGNVEALIPFGEEEGAKSTIWLASGKEIEVCESVDVLEGLLNGNTSGD